ncbi:hypothetical protein [Photobacterium alginatilyticum]|uniref:Uncharacterized protein n=1 Tax=Photobacterium alginatilyticum TaxID=1775171 RepID=A0ABW9YRG4_9GAMM|nr:hypothetical protein [Photobacterium alginatilyticum]NBI56293.1 hypothetical protein [Photobacterium alginatilyticum]
MEIELLKIIGLGMPTVFIFMVIYVHLLLGVSRMFAGIVKFILGMMLYIAFSVVIVSPVTYLIRINQPAIQESNYTFLAVLLSYLIIITPAIYYLIKVKKKELQRAGYFLSLK